MCECVSVLVDVSRFIDLRLTAGLAWQAPDVGHVGHQRVWDAQHRSLATILKAGILCSVAAVALRRDASRIFEDSRDF